MIFDLQPVNEHIWEARYHFYNDVQLIQSILLIIRLLILELELIMEIFE